MLKRRGISSVKSCRDAADSRHKVAAGCWAAMADHEPAVSSALPERWNTPGAIRSYNPAAVAFFSARRETPSPHRSV